MQTRIALCHDFYKSRTGRVLRRILKKYLSSLFPETQNEVTLIGVGYTIPYLPFLLRNDTSYMAINVLEHSASEAISSFHKGHARIVCAQSEHLPLENQSVDGALYIHALEYSHNIEALLAELMRVLITGGIAVFVVPNVSGLWAKAHETPFGQGAPFTLSQLESYILNAGFVIEAADEAVFMPPTQKRWVLKLAGFLEKTGHMAAPMTGGVHIVKAVKREYAGTPVSVKEKPQKAHQVSLAAEPQGRIF